MSSWEAAQPTFEAYLSEAGLAASTIKFYSRDLRAFFRWYEAQPQLTSDPTQFRSADVEAYKDYLTAQRGHSPATVNRILQSLRKYGQFRTWKSGQTHNAAGEVRLARLPLLAKPVVLAPEQQASLLLRAAHRTARHARRDYLIVNLLLQTGMRAGELRCLRLDQLEPARQQVRVEDEQGQRRFLPLPGELLAELTTYCRRSQLQTGDYLFPGREGGYMSVRMVQQLVTKLGRACGLELNVKVLRNSYAHSLWQQSGDLALLAERMGYRSMTSALRHIVPPRQVTEGDGKAIHL